MTNLLYLAHLHAQVPEVKQYLQIAEDELRRVCSITRQSLRLHKQQTAPQPVSPAKLLSDAAVLFRGRLHNASITLEERYRAGRPFVCLVGDLSHALGELIANAIAALAGGGTSRLRSREAKHWRTGQRGIALTISDNGAGIDDETRRRIFEPFFTTRGIAGVGLGLWIAEDVVKRHQGTVRLRSSQADRSHGTTVTLFLPDHETPRSHPATMPGFD